VRLTTLAVGSDLGGDFCGRGDCPIVGLGSFGTLAFLGPEGRPMDGTAHSKGSPANGTNYYKVHWKEKELSCVNSVWLIFYTMGRRTRGMCGPIHRRRRRPSKGQSSKRI